MPSISTKYLLDSQFYPLLPTVTLFMFKIMLSKEKALRISELDQCILLLLFQTKLQSLFTSHKIKVKHWMNQQINRFCYYVLVCSNKLVILLGLQSFNVVSSMIVMYTFLTSHNLFDNEGKTVSDNEIYQDLCFYF